MIHITADLHIKNRLWNNCTKIQGDSYEALTSFPVANDDILIDCGDIFDVTRPKAEDVAAAQLFLEKFKKVYAIIGNHDKTYPTWLSMLLPAEKLVLLSDIPVKPAEATYLSLFGHDYTTSREELLEFLQTVADYPPGMGTKVIVLHQAFKEILSIPGAFELSYDDLTGIFGDQKVIVLAGHVHVHKIINKVPNIVLCSPGPLVPQDLQQAKNPCYHCMIQKGQIKASEAPTRAFKFLDGSTPGFDLCKALEGFRNPFPELPPAVVVSLNADQKLPAVPASIKESFVVIFKRQSMLDVLSDSSQAAEVQACTLEEAILQEIEQTEPVYGKQIKAITDHLLKTDDPVAFLDSVLTKWKAIRS